MLELPWHFPQNREWDSHGDCHDRYSSFLLAKEF
jgi:hypothetical protein